ncbi:LysR substrate-binding domain-containing protein [Chlorogloeopsis sp. ULAP01]|uniref:LysR substrate-binding domain-containing protein n=1 Tax=Chlorogloeopsis sp. ULAP01 TaxID=3056483 RepID=UPI0025AB2975|nr:LysR substrate-binding domain-containing protein [Chlorogloeopsis sp. ULAP01]MDM9383641.1 LysR substrate-binding domain-containing protein [Chlorogloeopsis sp. ULAP01]
MNIELRHLHYFIAVAEELNFGRAAERLHIAQPPLTRQIRHLEEELGVKLFHRTTRRIQLTEPGRVYLAEARRVLAQIQEGIVLARLASRGEIGRLVIGFEGSSAYDIVPLSVKVFKERFPKVNLIVYEMTTGDQVQALHNAHIEIGFVVPPLSNACNLMVENILREPLVVALPQTHHLSNQSELNMANLNDETFIICPRHHKCGLYDHVIAVCHQAGFSPRLTQETSEVQSILGFVAAGLGVALLPASVTHLQKSGVVYRRLQPPTAELELAIAWQREKSSPMLPAFIEIVKEFARQMANENGYQTGE